MCKSNNKLCCFCPDETVSHLLFECVYTRKVWKFVIDVLQVGGFISHDHVIFGVDLNLSMDHIVSIIVYYIYKKWLICSFKNTIQRPDISHTSLITYLKIRLNVYSKCSDPFWHGVCNKLVMLVLYLDNGIAM